VSDGINSSAIDLNGTLQFTAGSNVTITENNGVITIAASGGGSLDVDLIEVGEADTDTVVISAEQSQNKALTLQSYNAAVPNQSNKINLPVSGAIEVFASQTVFGNNTGNSVINFTDSAWNIAGLITHSSGTLEVDPSTFFVNSALKVKSTTGTPTDTSTPASWLKVTVGSTDYYLPLYQ
jgi:hypothetical protein